MACVNRDSESQNWTHFVHIGGYSLNSKVIDQIIDNATDTHVFGIETDNDITGRYDSFIDPTEKLAAIKSVAEKAHKVGNYSFVYIAGLECITSNAGDREHTFLKDHPDWVQRDINGEPAVFSEDDAFWIIEGDEDVWISPYAKEWRSIYMERVRQIAATGIDGIYVDIPYWMTHFEGWEDTWASFDDYTVKAFYDQTGLDAQMDIRLGDLTDQGFLRWIDFRIQTLTDLMSEIDKNVKIVNPDCMTIAEIYPGIGEEVVKVGSDVYQLYEIVDAIAHEYSAGGYTAAERDPFDWFSYMAAMYTFRAFAEGKASWMLSYSWDEQENIRTADAMKNLAMSQLMAGTNVWDAKGHIMSSSNDMDTRRRIYKWIGDNESRFYSPRKPINPIGVYFSPTTRNYFPHDFTQSYMGILHLLLSSHLEFQIVTPRTLDRFEGKFLILPDVRCIDDMEMKWFDKYVDAGNSLIITGKSGDYTERRELRTKNPIHKLLGLSGKQKNASEETDVKFLYYPTCPGKKMMEFKRVFDQSALLGTYEDNDFYKHIIRFKGNLMERLGYEPYVRIRASPFVSTQTVQVDGKAHIYFANFKGLQGNHSGEQLPEKDIIISFPGKKNLTVYILPFLGQKDEVLGEWSQGRLSVQIPAFSKGMVVWIE